MVRKTKIIATVGPSVFSEQKIHKLIESGVDVLRVNFSHGSYEDHKSVIEWGRSSEKNIAIMQDIQGPKIRTGKAKENTFLEKSKNLVVVNKEQESSSECIYINYEFLLRDINVVDRIFIDDGQVVLKVTDKKEVNLPSEESSPDHPNMTDIGDSQINLKDQ